MEAGEGTMVRYIDIAFPSKVFVGSNLDTIGVVHEYAYLSTQRNLHAFLVGLEIYYGWGHEAFPERPDRCGSCSANQNR